MAVAAEVGLHRIAHSHADRNVAAAAYVTLVELPHVNMERKMLLGIKRRAEGR